MLNSNQIRERARNTLTNDIAKPLLLTLIFCAVSMGISMAISLISSIFSMFSAIIPILPSLISLLISLSSIIIAQLFSFGYYQSLMKIHRNEEFNYGDIFTLCFNNLKRNLAIIGQTLLKLWLPILLVVASYVIFFVLTVVSALIGGIFTTSIDSPDTAAVIFAIIIVVVMALGILLIFASFIYLYIRSLHYILTYYIAYDNPNITPKEVVEESERLMTKHRMDFFKLQLSFIGWSILACLTCGLGMLLLTPYMQFATIVFYEDRLTDSANINTVS